MMRTCSMLLLAVAVLFSASPASLKADEIDVNVVKSWFPDTPEPDWNSEPQTNGAFHMWAWQSFLWMMQHDSRDKLPRLERFANPDHLFVPAGQPLPYPGIPARSVRTMVPRVVKLDDKIDIEDIGQAGGGDVLWDQQSQVVYYEIRVNQTYYDHVRSNQFYVSKNVQNATPTDNFPAGSLETKSSWRLAQVGSSVLIANADKRFFTVDAMIAPMKNGKIDTKNLVAAKLALVGIHIVGIVEDHPEFLWATIEHVDNAPDRTARGLAKMTKSPSGNAWSFFNAGTDPPYNDPKTNPTNVVREFVGGGGPVYNVKNIIELNKAVHQAAPKGSLWQSYMLVGNLWTDGTLPTYGDTSNHAGSTKLSNATMETFHQKNLNCFSCHSVSKKSDSNLNISHLMFRAR